MQSSRYFYYRDDVAIIDDDLLKTEAVPAESIDLIVTSPPYNVDIQYNSNEDDLTYEEYLQFSRAWMSRCYVWLKSDGRLPYRLGFLDERLCPLCHRASGIDCCLVQRQLEKDLRLAAE